MVSIYVIKKKKSIKNHYWKVIVQVVEVVTVKLSPNHSNIMYVERRTDLETDFSESLNTLKEKQKDSLFTAEP